MRRSIPTILAALTCLLLATIIVTLVIFLARTAFPDITGNGRFRDILRVERPSSDITIYRVRPRCSIECLLGSECTIDDLDVQTQNDLRAYRPSSGGDVENRMLRITKVERISDSSVLCTLSDLSAGEWIEHKWFVYDLQSCRVTGVATTRQDARNLGLGSGVVLISMHSWR